MGNVFERSRRATASLAALALVAGFYMASLPPNASQEERERMGGAFRFESHVLPLLAGRTPKLVRAVHPSLQGIRSWISSVGAGAALGDLDKDDLPNDLCHVDPRTDQVIVAPVPGTGQRFAPFTLEPPPELFDPETMAPMGCLIADFNEDGCTDVLVYYWNRPPIAFLRKSGTPKAPAAGDFVVCEIAPAKEHWYTNALTLADLDGDGHLDLVLGNYYRDGARVLDAQGTGYQTMTVSFSHSFNGGGVRLMLWKGASAGEAPSVKFEESGNVREMPDTNGWTLAIGACDLDGDLLPEVYVANDFGPDRLLHNRSRPGQLQFVRLEGERGFAEPASTVLGQDTFKSMGVDFADLNGDGLPDIPVSNIGNPFGLLESNFVFDSTGRTEQMRDGVAPYVNRAGDYGLAWGGWAWDIKADDFNNGKNIQILQATGLFKGTVDRWPEIQELGAINDVLTQDPRTWHHFEPGADVGGQQHLNFFVRDHNGRYHDVALEAGLDRQQVSRGIAIADVDGDGLLDFVVANQWEDSYFYHNVSPKAGSFLGLRLRLPFSADTSPDKSIRPAVGAAVTVWLPGDSKPLTAQVDGGNGHSGKRSPEIHFGLGQTPAVKLRIEVRWRDMTGSVQKSVFHRKPGWHTLVLGRTASEDSTPN